MADCSQNNHTDELLNTDMNDSICIVGDATFSNRRNIVIFHRLRGLRFINNAAKTSNRGILRTEQTSVVLSAFIKINILLHTKGTDGADELL